MPPSETSSASPPLDDNSALLATATLPHFKTVDSVLASDEARAFHHRLVAALFLANACDAVEVRAERRVAHSRPA
jgi:hypothetical protein